MDERYYLYALTWADCPQEGFGPGVDPRFPAELIRCGRLAALTSRVGWDDRDLAKLQEGSADPAWVSKVAVRHHEVVETLARHWSVLPMRLGTLFRSRSSLIAKLAPCEAKAAEFLRRLEDRQEWAAKLYVAAASETIATERTVGRAERAPPFVAANSSGGARSARPTLPYRNPSPRGGDGAEYLAAQVERARRRRQSEAVIRRAIVTVEARLQRMADSWQRLAPLPTALTHRADKMVWNGALLLASSAIAAFQTACGQLGSELAPEGLLLEVTGPWPPYHFAPSLEPPQTVHQRT
jgi:hypothetical protein